MKFLYVLALALIIFEGFISQCEGAGGSNKAIRGKIGNLSIELVEDILFRAGLNALKNAIKGGIKCEGAIKRIFEDRIIYVDPTCDKYDIGYEEIHEIVQDDDIYIIIKGFNKTLSLFDTVGDHIKKIKVRIHDAFVYRHQINKKITRYSQKLTELHIVTKNSFSAFLDELSEIVKKIQFPNVKKLFYQGPFFETSYDLNLIFPRLENLTLSHPFMQVNMTCLANVRKLKELKLGVESTSYKLPDLENIFKKNDELSSLALVLENDINIFYAAHMTKLQTLEIRIIGYQFLDHVSENHPFRMPKVKSLKLREICWDPRIIKFINCFRNLEILDAQIHINLVLRNIKDLIEIHELITYSYPEPNDLIGALKKIGRKENLKKIMFVDVSQSDCKNYYMPKMDKINEELRKSKEPTWRMKCTEYKRQDSMEMLRKK